LGGVWVATDDGSTETTAVSLPVGAALRDAVPPLDLLRCPITGSVLHREGTELVAASGHRYRSGPHGIPLFAEEFCTADARVQQLHYETIADAYITNLGYPHTRAYIRYLDDAMLAEIDATRLGTIAEVCCGRGEAFQLLGRRIGRGIGVDISVAMLNQAVTANPDPDLYFVQGDATALPLAEARFDSVFMLGGVHHVRNRNALFAEVSRILKPGGHFYFREPVSDFILWRAIRAVIYRLSPTLDHETERPLLYDETAPVLTTAGLTLKTWKTVGFLGFCVFMNSDVLVFNRLFRFIPGITAITRGAARFDAWTTALPGLQRAGLQVIGVAEKSAHGACASPSLGALRSSA
jgi:SAM-dependent methyltransferase